MRERQTLPGVLATFAGAVLLHTLWDTVADLPAFIILGVLSLAWLFLALRRYRTFGDNALRLSPLTI